MTAALMAVITPVVNACSAVIFETYRGEKTDLRRLLRKILVNPMVLSSLLGIAFSLLRIPIPTLLKTGVLKKLSAMSTPLALIALGATFDFSDLRTYARPLLAVSVCKLAVMPALALSGAALLGIRGADLLAVAIFSGAPAAVNTYSTAAAMGGNEILAGQIVVLTSTISLLTMFLWFCLLGGLGLI